MGVIESHYLRSIDSIAGKILPFASARILATLPISHYVQQPRHLVSHFHLG